MTQPSEKSSLGGRDWISAYGLLYSRWPDFTIRNQGRSCELWRPKSRLRFIVALNSPSSTSSFHDWHCRLHQLAAIANFTRPSRLSKQVHGSKSFHFRCCWCTPSSSFPQRQPDRIAPANSVQPTALCHSGQYSFGSNSMISCAMYATRSYQLPPSHWLDELVSDDHTLDASV